MFETHGLHAISEHIRLAFIHYSRENWDWCLAIFPMGYSKEPGLFLNGTVCTMKVLGQDA